LLEYDFGKKGARVGREAYFVVMMMMMKRRRRSGGGEGI
jgi:hypothetical protein